VLWVERFTLEGSAVGDVRRHSRRVEAAGLEVRHFFPLPDPTAFDPGRDHDHLLDQLRVVSQEWLRTRHGLEKGFCMGRFEPARLRESWLAVVWNPGVRRVEAFVTWVPVWGRRGWVLDLVRRRADAPGGVMEFLVVRSVEAARARGDHLLSLALSALAKVDQEPIEPEAAAPGVADELGGTREFIKEHLARFYDFEGLFHWKKKFNPSFEDRYLVYPHPLALPRVALALARAQSPGGLRSYFRRGSGLPAPRGRSSSPART
jgi:phosphatidylglycerol lysyltransferase